MNNRRKLVLALGAAALASPLTPHAQPATKVWRVGFLSGRNQPGPQDPNPFESFAIGMRELGYVDAATQAQQAIGQLEGAAQRPLAGEFVDIDAKVEPRGARP